MNKELKFLIYNSPEEEVKVNVVVKDVYDNNLSTRFNAEKTQKNRSKLLF